MMPDVSAIVLVLIAVLHPGPGSVAAEVCTPAEEGAQASLTCTVATASCFPFIVLRWYAASTSTALHNATVVCYHDHCNSTYYSSHLSATIVGTRSVLTLNSASRTDPIDMETSWTCVGTCDSKEIAVCDTLNIYAKPEQPECTMKENKQTQSGDLKSVTLTCSTSRVYPEAKCKFERITNGGNPTALSQIPSYQHPLRNDGAAAAVYYMSECSVTVAVEDLGEGTHTFQGYIYPGVTDGIDLVNAVTIPGSVFIAPPQNPIECPPQSSEGCNCSLESDCRPEDIEQTYFCKNVSDLSKSLGSILTAKFLYESVVSLSLDAASPEFDQGATPTLSCTVRGTGSGSPSTAWAMSMVRERTGEQLLDNGQGILGAAAAVTHTMRPLGCQDTGVYVCTGHSDQDTLTAEISIGVKCFHQLLNSDADPPVSGKLGDHFKMDFEVYGYPEPSRITLMRNTDRTNQTGSPRHTMIYFPSKLPFGFVHLTISDLVEEDFANHTIVVDNGEADALAYDFYLSKDSEVPTPPIQCQKSEDDDDDVLFGENLTVIIIGVTSLVIIAALSVVIIILVKKIHSLRVTESNKPLKQDCATETETGTSDGTETGTSDGTETGTSDGTETGTSNGYIAAIDAGSAAGSVISFYPENSDPASQYLSIQDLGPITMSWPYDNNNYS